MSNANEMRDIRRVRLLDDLDLVPIDPLYDPARDTDTSAVSPDGAKPSEDWMRSTGSYAAVTGMTIVPGHHVKQSADELENAIYEANQPSNPGYQE